MKITNRKIILYTLLIGTILIACGAYLWFSTLEKWTPPAKQERVPEDAVWAGGTDGGCFFVLKTEFSDTSRFAVYFDQTGDIWYDGYFYCDKSNFHRISKMNWRELVTCYNGKYIFMRDPDNEKKEIVWHKVMPENIPDPDEVYWMEGAEGGWFFELHSVLEDTSHFVIYHGITGEVLHDGLFYCNPNDYARISEEMNWSSLLDHYERDMVYMRDPNDKNRKIIWHSVE